MGQYHENINSVEEAIEALFNALESDNSAENMQRVIASFPEYASKLKGLYATWISMGAINVPDIRPEVDAKFYKMLTEKSIFEENGKSTSKLGLIIISWFQNPRLWSLLGAIVIGIIIGMIAKNEKSVNENIQPQVGKISMFFANNNVEMTPFERMDKIQQTRDISEPNPKILEALNRTLLHDENVNVRLSALETLIVFSEYPIVREYLIKSIPYQESSIVLMELAELMIQLQEKDSSDAWKKLLDSEHMEKDVKTQLEQKLALIL
ncbi:MAG: hypothetical protein V3V00_04000 [Saprospiraceae bacterium]